MLDILLRFILDLEPADQVCGTSLARPCDDVITGADTVPACVTSLSLWSTCNACDVSECRRRSGVWTS
jgi:hypothetical protein